MDVDGPARPRELKIKGQAQAEAEQTRNGVKGKEKEKEAVSFLCHLRALCTSDSVLVSFALRKTDGH